MNENSDVIVIGGGPAGSFTGLNLARLGVSVTVLEEHSQVGIPSHCPGHLSFKGLKNLGLHPLPTHVVENSFNGVNFYSPQGNMFSVRLQSPTTCAVNRAHFDKHIAEEAIKSGAQYCLNSRAESLVIENGFVKGVYVKENGETEEKRARVVIDAEGVSSRILKQTGLRGLDTCCLVNGIAAEVENVKDIDTDTVEVYLGKTYAPGFYAWLIPKADSTAKIGLAAKTGNPKRLLERLINKHPVAKAKLSRSRIAHAAFHPLTLGGPIRQTFSNGFLAVGDAASQVKPTTGGGVVFGMSCAKTAAETVHAALQRNNVSAKSLGSYQNRCKKALGFDLNFMIRIRKVLDSMSDAQLDNIVSMCSKLELNKTLDSVEEIDLQGKMLLRTLRNPRMIRAMAFFIYFYLARNL